MKILFFSNNQHKINEVKNILSSVPFDILTLSDIDQKITVEETGLNYLENALLKAKTACELTGMSVLADDSGIEVDAIPDELGVFSARFGGPGLSDRKKNALLLKRLERIPVEKRTAKFVSVVVFYNPDKTFYSFQGSLDGLIAESTKGQNGFGYDPVFYLPNYKCSVADLSHSDKNNISHRSIAFRKFEDWYVNVFTKEV